MAYIADPLNATKPTDNDAAGGAAEELRQLKGRVNSLESGVNQNITNEAQNRIAGDNGIIATHTADLATTNTTISDNYNTLNNRITNEKATLDSRITSEITNTIAYVDNKYSFVDNTSDLNKPVSYPQEAYIAQEIAAAPNISFSAPTVGTSIYTRFVGTTKYYIRERPDQYPLVITNSTTNTIGKAGATGVTFTWSALNDIPSDAKYVEVYFNSCFFYFGTTGNKLVQIYIKDINNTLYFTRVFRGYQGTEGLGNSYGVIGIDGTKLVLPIDSLGRIRIDIQDGGASSFSLQLLVTGFFTE